MASEATFKIEYATTDRSSCKYKKCTDKKIVKGTLRVGKEFPSERFTEGGTQRDWFHPACVFETFRRARPTTKKIESPTDLAGFDALSAEDQSMLRKLIAAALPTYGKGAPKSPKKPKPKDAQLPIAPAVTAAAASSSSSSSSSTSANKWTIALTSEDGRVVRLGGGGGKHAVGRGELLGVTDKRCSRRQVELALTVPMGENKPRVVIRSMGVNLGCLYRDGDAPVVMKQGIEYSAGDGDQFTLVADKLPFTIHIVPAIAADDDEPRLQPPPAKRAKEEGEEGETESTSAVAAAPIDEDTRPECQYGLGCTRKNPQHFKECHHPPGHPLAR